MNPRQVLFGAVVLGLASGPLAAEAKTLKSSIAFNTGIGQKTEDQPSQGIKVSYQVTLAGGDLDGCMVDIVEVLVPYEEGAWGFFDIQGDLACDRGGFAYTSAGAWDGNGFHAAGEIDGGSGTGEFEGVSGRIAQLNGGGKDAGDGTSDIAYDLVVATEQD